MLSGQAEQTELLQSASLLRVFAGCGVSPQQHVPHSRSINQPLPLMTEDVQLQRRLTTWQRDRAPLPLI